jgi:hypothetical protein
MFQPSVNQISSAYLGNPNALQAKVQQEQKGRPGIPPDLRDLLALQDIQSQKEAYARQMAMQPPQPTVADQLIQSVKQPLPEPGQQAMPQAMPQGMPQGAPQGMPPGMPQGAPQMQGLPQGLPQGMAPSMAPAPQPGLQQLPSNIGQHLSGGGIVAFAEGNEVERDTLRRMEAAYDPAVTEELNKANTVPPAYTMPAELIQRARDIEAQALNQNPEQAKAAAIREYQREVGNRDTSQYDRLIAEYENRKKQLEGPKPGIDALMEYLGMVAATPRGRSWTEAGSMAARSQNALQQERQSQQFELTKQGLEAAQKKADIIFGEKKDLFGTGRAAYDQAFKVNYETALKMTGNAFEAEKLAKQMTDKELDRVSAEKMAKERNATSIATANAPGQSERMANRIMALERKGTPEALAEAKRLQDIYGSITGSGNAGVGAAKNLTANLKLVIAGYNNILDPLKGANTSEAEKDEARRKLPIALKRLEVLGGIVDEENGGASSPTSTTPTTVIKFDAAGNPIKG